MRGAKVARYLLLAALSAAPMPSMKIGQAQETETSVFCDTLGRLTGFNLPFPVFEQLCAAAKAATSLTQLPQEKKKHKEPRLFIARRFDVISVNLSIPNRYTFKRLPLSNTVLALGVDYDVIDDAIYWSSRNLIQRAKINGTDQEEIFNDLGDAVDGLAIDWVAKNLYWTDSTLDHIGVARYNGSSRKYLLKNLSNPRGIALDPGEGKMYWTEWGKPPRIASATLGGKNVKTLVGDGIHWPNGIALDLDRRLLYFADAGYDRIEVMRIDGSKRRILLGEDVSHIYGLSYSSGYLYWTDWKSLKAERVDISNISTRETLVNSAGRMFGLKATPLKPFIATNACAEDNGGCSHLCFYSLEGVQCGCPEGVKLDASSIKCVS